MKVEVDGKTYVSAPEDADLESCDGCVANDDDDILCGKIHDEIGDRFCFKHKSIFKLEK